MKKIFFSGKRKSFPKRVARFHRRQKRFKKSFSFSSIIFRVRFSRIFDAFQIDLCVSRTMYITNRRVEHSRFSPWKWTSPIESNWTSFLPFHRCVAFRIPNENEVSIFRSRNKTNFCFSFKSRWLCSLFSPRTPTRSSIRNRWTPMKVNTNN